MRERNEQLGADRAEAERNEPIGPDAAEQALALLLQNRAAARSRGVRRSTTPSTPSG